MAVDAPRYDAKAAADVPYVDVAAVLDRAGKTISLFIIAKHPDEETELSVDLAGFPAARPVEHTLIHHSDLMAVNSADKPDEVTPQSLSGTVRVESGRLQCRLRPRSYNLIRLAV